MNKKIILDAVKAAKDSSKREFTQTYELIINLRGLNLKLPEHHVDLLVELPHPKGKPVKIAALVGPELVPQAKQACDFVVSHDDFPAYTQDKKKIKKLAGECSYFIAQANLMADVAKTFGRVLGPRNKMPNPKAGCVVAPNANLTALTAKLRNTVRLLAKIQPSIKLAVGTQTMNEEHVADNISAIYNALVHVLPQESYNIRKVLIKLTMGPTIEITEKTKETPTKK